MERVLVTGAANIGKAGVATIVYKWGQEFDPDILVYDYLMQSGLPDEQYQIAIKEKGGIMYTIDGSKSIVGVIRWVKRIISENHYKVLHINSDSAYVAAAYIFAAKRAGIKKIYVHSHCTQIDDNNRIRRAVKAAFHKICIPYVNTNTEMFLACSQLAGEWMFGKKNVRSNRYRTIYNGVEVEKYLFDADMRSKYRHDIGLDGKFVIGNIGRFSFQKNQSFLIDVFKTYHNINKESMLVLIGVGELEKTLKIQVSEAGLNDSIVFLGTRNDVPLLLSAIDLIVMPSRFEGLPVTMVEAQMSALPCVVSGAITKEAKFTDNVAYVDSWDISEWVINISDMAGKSRNISTEQLTESAFNIRRATKELENILLFNNN